MDDFLTYGIATMVGMMPVLLLYIVYKRGKTWLQNHTGGMF